MPEGGPELSAIRELVISAFVRTKSPQVIAESPAIELELLAALDEFLETKPSALVGERLWTATDAVTHLAKARSELGRIVDEDLRARLDQQLLAACDAIASVGAPVHFLEKERRYPTFDEQVAALASVGVIQNPGTAREDLLRNYSEGEIETAPWYRLADLLEHATGFAQFAAEQVEYPGEDDEAYTSLVTRLAALGQVPVENVRGAIDWDAQTIWVEFELDRQTHRIEPRFGSYLDTSVFRRIAGFVQAPLALYWLDYDPDHDSGTYLVIATDLAGYQRLRAAGAPFSPIADRTSSRDP
ncbi:MAG: hypothetical protein QM831_12465 [Kofleriaceae bacterium]